MEFNRLRGITLGIVISIILAGCASTKLSKLNDAALNCWYIEQYSEYFNCINIRER